ncbi:MAG: hypothetical protein WCR07_05470, partial [Verrucomicrobiota bacterium]
MSYQVFKKGRGGSTFKPSGGIAARPARPAPAPQQPTPSSPTPRTRDSSSPQAEERRNRRRLEEEIRRAENLAAGLPEDAVPESAPDYAASGRDQSYRRPIDDDDESHEPRRTAGRPDDRDRREDERGDALRRNDEGERDEAGADR